MDYAMSASIFYNMNKVETRGRPKAFKSVEELQEKLDAYFADCAERKEPPFIMEMCVFLGICRDTLLEYQKDPIFSDSIKKAKVKCESAIERGILTGKMNAVAGIFNLKNNYGWKDKTEQTIDNRLSLNFDRSFAEKDED